VAQSLADVVIHIVFSTKERTPWIDAMNNPKLYAYICGICRYLDCPAIKINGVIKYIEKQKEHHKTQIFKEGFFVDVKNESDSI
jgi:hypothetical protein